MGELVYSVAELNGYVQRLLSMETLLQGVQVRGEVSNCKTYPSGHTYFSLKDEQATLRCVWFKNNRSGPASALRNGMRVVAKGTPTLYVRDGQFQLVVSTIQADGVGAWYEWLHRLKEKLQAEGLFDASRKQPLPVRPRRIGIVTSPKGAVVQDIIRVAHRRSPSADLLLYPVLVQGETAPEEITRAIQWFSSHPVVDVLIVGRGGGSIEDLWAFNDEGVVRAVAACPIPIISAVGHETDTTLCDFAADVQVATPSMAAELAAANDAEWAQRVDTLSQSLSSAMAYRVAAARQRLQTCIAQLEGQSSAARLNRQTQRLSEQEARLGAAMQRHLGNLGQALAAKTATLKALDPKAVLGRGYTLVQAEDGALLTRAAQARPGQLVTLEWLDGMRCARIQEEEDHGK
jgi:exodeoxyribonuclease VII large subunit